MPKRPIKPDEARKALFARPTRRVGSFAIVQPQRINATVMSAGGLVVPGQARTVDRHANFDRTWQPQAYDYLTSAPELGYVQHLTANTIAACHFKVMEKASLSDGVEFLSEDPRVARVMSAFTGERGGIALLRQRAGLHLGVGGETYLLGTDQFDELGIGTGIFWEFVSTEELRTHRDGTMIRRWDGANPETVDPNHTYIARCWSQDPRFSGRADSPVRRVMVLLNELVRLTQLVDAVIKSRLSAGILLMKKGMDFPTEDDDSTDSLAGYGDSGISPFIRTLIKHMRAPVNDRSDQASLIPLVVEAEIEGESLAGLMQLISLSRDMEAWALDLRAEALERLSYSLDIPAEMLKGVGGANHWGAHVIESSFVVKHVQPPLALQADFDTHAYLRPMLVTFEGMDPAEAARFRIEGDVSPVVSKIDEANSARLLFDRMELSGKAMRQAAGFGEDDAPLREERQRRMVLELMHKSPLLAPYLLNLIPGFEHIVIPPGLGVGTHDQPGTGTQPDAAPAVGPAPVGAAPPLSSPLAASQAALVDRIATWADAALQRAWERAGAKVKTAAHKDQALADRLQSVTKMKVLSAISPADLTRMKLSPATLLGDAWDDFALEARGWVRDWLIVEALEGNPLNADELAAAAVSEVCRNLDAFALANLHRPFVRQANKLRVSNDLVAPAIEMLSTMAGA